MKKFNERCYQALKLIPKGKVTTYKEIARYLGSNGYRAVGNAMSKNPNAPQVPCHRVVCSDGKIGGYAFGVKKKIDLLSKEKISVKNGKVENLKTNFHVFKGREK